MAKAAGASVIATGGSNEKMAACRQLGADVAVNYKTDDVDAAVREFAPEGVNLFWETQREPNFDKIVEYLAPRGRIVLMAGRDARPEFPVGPFYVRAVRCTASSCLRLPHRSSGSAPKISTDGWRMAS
jgi:NADPH2:quinone reductase